MNTRTLKKSLLVVEDDINFRDTLALELSDSGYNVVAASSLKEFRALEEKGFDYAVIDLKLKGESGLAVLEDLLTHAPSCRAVMLTGYGSIATAVRAIKMGAIDYLSKPANVLSIEQCMLKETAQTKIETKEKKEASIPSLARNEREYIENILVQCDGNVSKAAKKLGIHRQSLQRKLRKYPPRH